MNRIRNYNTISTSLACLSNEKLTQLLDNAKLMHEGISGTSALIFIDNIPVFVKKVALTALELEPENMMSTANIFNLPLYYQYGVGSAGFGAWRELAAHIMSTNWVITSVCPNFPILYHWRVLPKLKNDVNVEEWGDFEKYGEYWGNSKTILRRMQALNNSATSIVLFLEYIPDNLNKWLNAQIAKGSDAASEAVIFIDKHLKIANVCMNTQGLMHFDAHFYNILTDGERLYFSDFGLALSSKFDLSPNERDFLKQHYQYDQTYAALNLVRSVLIGYFGEGGWEIRLEKYSAGAPIDLPPIIANLIKHYMPLAKTLEDFLQKLRKESKTTTYPAIPIEKLLTTNH